MTTPHIITVALVGNPNTGKTTLFNALAGMNQRVGNYPGVTVETKKGRCRHEGETFDIIDLPGTYSLAARSPDEMVAVEVILGQRDAEHKPDVVIAIVDASNLERNLFLASQVFELGVPVIVALNMLDVAEHLGLKIDVARLEKNLGVPVVPIQANRGTGLDTLKAAVKKASGSFSEKRAPTPFPEDFEREVALVCQRLGQSIPQVLARRLLLDVGGQAERRVIETKDPTFAAELHDARKRLAQAGCGVPGIEARTRYAWIRKATADCVSRPKERHVTWTDRIDRVLTHRLWGTVLFLALMLVVFISLFQWAKPFMDLIVAGKDHLSDAVKGAMEPGPLRSLLADGIINGVGSVLVFVPQILILFAFVAVLEDCGYMARAAYLMDRLMSRAGLNGKSFIPLLSSVACAVPGIMAARVIENRRDRLATILVAPLMSCSARLPVYYLLIGAFFTDGYSWWVPGVVLFAMYMIGFVLAPLVAFLLKRTVLRGETPAFVMEMPLYKLPSPSAVLRRSFEAGWMFIARAGTVILASMIVIWALLYFPSTARDGTNFEQKVASEEAAMEEPLQAIESLEQELEKAKSSPQGDLAEADAIQGRIEVLRERIKPHQDRINAVNQEWKAQSWLGRMGHVLEPVFRPLGWDWRVGMAALASFPAREVIVGVLGIVFGEGETDAGEEAARNQLGSTLRRELGTQGQGFAIALSIMVFFALCAQCASTLAIIRREANGWGWAIFTFVYMTGLAYTGAFLTFQIASRFA